MINRMHRMTARVRAAGNRRGGKQGVQMMHGKLSRTSQLKFTESDDFYSRKSKMPVTHVSAIIHRTIRYMDRLSLYRKLSEVQQTMHGMLLPLLFGSFWQRQTCPGLHCRRVFQSNAARTLSAVPVASLCRINLDPKLEKPHTSHASIELPVLSALLSLGFCDRPSSTVGYL